MLRCPKGRGWTRSPAVSALAEIIFAEYSKMGRVSRLRSTWHGSAWKRQRNCSRMFAYGSVKPPIVRASIRFLSSTASSAVMLAVPQPSIAVGHTSEPSRPKLRKYLHPKTERQGEKDYSRELWKSWIQLHLTVCSHISSPHVDVAYRVSVFASGAVSVTNRAAGRVCPHPRPSGHHNGSREGRRAARVGQPQLQRPRPSLDS